MKKTFYLFSALFLFLLAACGGGQDADVNGQDYFDAVVVDILDGSLSVKCTACESGNISAGNEVTVPLNVVSASGVPDVAVGDSIRVVFDGSVMESYPLQLGAVYAIYLLDENGEVVDNA